MQDAEWQLARLVVYAIMKPMIILYGFSYTFLLNTSRPNNSNVIFQNCQQGIEAKFVNVRGRSMFMRTENKISCLHLYSTIMLNANFVDEQERND